MCQRSSGKYFGTRRSSTDSRVVLPCASRSVHRPPIQARRAPPQTTRKFGSPKRFVPPARATRSAISAGASCVSRVTRIRGASDGRARENFDGMCGGRGDWTRLREQKRRLEAGGTNGDSKCLRGAALHRVLNAVRGGAKKIGAAALCRAAAPFRFAAIPGADRASAGACFACTSCEIAGAKVTAARQAVRKVS